MRIQKKKHTLAADNYSQTLEHLLLPVPEELTHDHFLRDEAARRPSEVMNWAIKTTIPATALRQLNFTADFLQSLTRMGRRL